MSINDVFTPEHLSAPDDLNVTIKTFYKGDRKGKEFFDNHPELLSLYPSKQEVLSRYTQEKNKEENRGRYVTLILNENKPIEVEYR